MIQVPVDPSIVKYQLELLQQPVFDEADQDCFFQDMNSSEDDIWNCVTPPLYPDHDCQSQLLTTEQSEPTSKSDWSLAAELLGSETTTNSFCEAVSDVDREERQDRLHDTDEDIDMLLHSRFVDETVAKISEGAKPMSKKPYRLDELFKKVIRALSSHMRKVFEDYLHGADHSKISEAEMEDLLRSFLKTRYQVEDLDPEEILVGKKVLYSIAIKGRQVSFGNEFSVIIRNLRCEFVEIGTKKSGLAFFQTKVGKAVFWPIFRRIIARILEEGSSQLQLKYLVKSFAKFTDKVQA